VIIGRISFILRQSIKAKGKERGMNDGGWAFPFEYGDGVNMERKWECGMSLRDYFAAKAIGLLMNSPTFVSATVEDFAQKAYQLADAMITERDKKV